MKHIVYSIVLYCIYLWMIFLDILKIIENLREISCCVIKKRFYFEYKIEEWKHGGISQITDLLEGEFTGLMDQYSFKNSEFSIDYLFVNILYNTNLLCNEENGNLLQEKNTND